MFLNVKKRDKNEKGKTFSYIYDANWSELLGKHEYYKTQ